jgi:peptide/nickel transport system substrate-binding protein
MWHSTQIGGDGQNYAGLDSRDIDELLEQARQSTDQGERAELYRDFQNMFADEVPALLLYYPVYNYAVDEMVKGVQLSPMMDPSDRFRTIAQWYIKTRRVMVSEAGVE